DPSKVIDIELTGHMIAVNNQKDSVYPLPISGKKKKAKSQTVTPTLPKSQGPETFGALFKKRKQPKSKKTPTETKVDETQSTRMRMKWLKRGDEDVFAAREDMDGDTQATKEEHESPPSNMDKPKSSYTQDTNESASDSSSPELQKYDNILPFTERHLASIKGYYEENVDHKDHTDKLVQANMDCHDKNSTKRAELLTALNGVNETLKVIQEAVKEDPALNKKVLNLGPRMTAIENSQAAIRYEVSSLRQDTLEIKSMMTKIFQAFKGKSSTLSSSAHTKEPPSHTEGEHVTMEDETKKSESNKVERPTRAVPILAFKPLMRPNHEVEMMSSPLTVRLTDTLLEFLIFNSSTEIELIASLIPQPTKTSTSEAQPITTIINISHPKKDPDEPIRVPYMKNGKMYHLTNDEINEHLEKEDKIKKAVEEAKRFKMTKTEVIKIVQEEAEKIGIDPKKIISTK
ncbi:hypothetical protein Tco_0553795, partial [Tanacetum coccineum]